MTVFGLQVNRAKDPQLEAARAVLRAVGDCGARLMAGESVAGELADCLPLDYGAMDAMIIVGGDGTILKYAADCARANVPVLGVNSGRLGFLTEVEPKNIGSAVRRVIEGDYICDSRMMLAASTKSVSGDMLALNEVLAYKNNISRTVELSWSVDGVFVDRTICDGLLISTPTGSTAYSLSAGGPILLPSLDCIAITPVCAHSLGSCPIVIGGDSVISVTNDYSEDAAVAVDGGETGTLPMGGSLEIRRSEYVSKFIRLNDISFYHLLRDKLSH